jgi:aminotransferase
MAHGVPVAVPTYAKDKFSLDPAALEKAITPRTKALLLNFPCNPTGATLTMKQTEAIAVIAKKHDLIVLTDHIYSELTYGAMTPSIATLPGMKERTIFLHGFSKAFAMTGLRIGYACGPEDIIDAMMKIHQYSMLCAPVTSQDAAEEALLSAKNDMEQMREEYKIRRGVIVKRLNAMGLDCLMPNGSFYVFPDIRSTGLSSQEFAMRLLDEQKVAVVPGPAFGDCAEGYVRCSYATSLEKINIAMDRMEEFLKNLKKSGAKNRKRK